MTKQDFISFLSNNEALSELNIRELNAVIENHPYFQSAWFLYLKSLLQNHHLRLNTELKRGVIQVTDRKKLYNFLHKQKTDSPKQFFELIQDKPIFETSFSSDKINTTTGNKQLSDEIKFTSISGDTSKTAQNDNEPTDIAKELKRLEAEIQELTTATFLQQQIDLLKAELKELDSTEVKPEQQQDKHPKEKTEQKKTEKNNTGNKIKETEEDEVEQKEKTEQIPQKKKHKQNKQLITKFLQEKPRIKIDKSKLDNSTDLSEKSTAESEGIMTEALANIYIKQGLFDKALNIYEKLSLKYPEKNSYFAARIQKIEDLKLKNINK